MRKVKFQSIFRCLPLFLSFLVSGCSEIETSQSTEIATPSQTQTSESRRSLSSFKAVETKLTPIPKPGQRAARRWLTSQGYNLKLLKAMPIPERAARLNQAVYDFCESGTPTVPNDINDLFEDCRTACGGFSYVLRALLEATGAETRYVDLLNIPQQGNHTAVEVKSEQGWVFFDPTFGAFFTADGTVQGRVLNLSEITSATDKVDLEARVLQSPNKRINIMETPLSKLYSENFHHTYMDLQNYQLPEALSYSDPREMLLLEVDMRLQNGHAKIGDLNADNFQDLSDAWLRDTNAILNNDDLTDDTSYNSAKLWGSKSAVTVIALDDAQVGNDGLISLVFWNLGPQEATMQIMPMGKTLSLDQDRLISLPLGRSILNMRFRAQERNARFAIRNTETSGKVYMFGVSITHLDQNMQSEELTP